MGRQKNGILQARYMRMARIGKITPDRHFPRTNGILYKQPRGQSQPSRDLLVEKQKRRKNGMKTCLDELAVDEEVDEEEKNGET